MSAGRVILRHGRAIALAAALIFGVGLFAYARLPRGLYPELSFPRIAVVATLPDATAEIVLRNVTRVLEEGLISVLGVKRVRSRSIRGAAELSLLFDADSDMVIALQLVQARLAEVRGELPTNTTLVAERVTPTSFPVFTVNVEGSVAPALLRDVALYQVRPALSRVPEVGPITVTAGDEREVEVTVDPARAEAAGLTLEEIARRLGESNRFLTVGRIDRAYRRYVIALEGYVRDPAALGNFVVGGNERTPVRLSDVAQIAEGHADPRLSVRSPRGPAAVVNVARRIGGDVVGLDAALAAAITRLQAELPPGVTLSPVYQQAPLIAAATGAVRDAIVLGGLFAALVLLYFLRDGRATLVAVLVIPVSLVAACAVVYLTRGSLNVMSLGGLAIAVGLVIDDAVVVVEAIHRELAAGRTKEVAAEVAISKVGGPVLSSTVTTVVVFAPLAFVSGVVGTFFSALAIALAAAVVASLVVALTQVPLLSVWALASASGSRHPRDPLAGGYDVWLRRSLGRPRLVVGGALVFVSMGVLAARWVKSGFVPELDEGAYVFDYFTPIGTSLAEADKLASGIDDLLRADPDVRTFTRRLGAELGPPRATETSRGDIIVRLKEHRRRSVEEVMEAQRRKLAAQLPGVRVELLQLLSDMLGDLEGNPEPIELKLFGDDQAELRRQAKRVADAIRDVDGLADLFDGQLECSPERIIHLDPVALGRSGLTTESAAAQLSAALLGAEAAPLPAEDRLIPVRVRWPDSARFDEQALERVRIHAPGGAWVPLLELGRVEDACAPSELTRENLRLMIPVTARLQGRDLGSAVHEIEQRLKAVKLPRGYDLEIGGQRRSQLESFRALGVALGAAVALVLLVLVAQFGRFSAPLAILAATPLALSGGVVTLVATGTPLNVSSLLGAVLLVGLVVKNGILLLHQAAEEEASGLDVAEALIAAGRLRLRPILMTTLCTVVGLVPLAVGIGEGAELHQPLAVAVLGGLSVSTVGTLFLVPAIYRLLRRRRGVDVSRAEPRDSGRKLRQEPQGSP
jgi:CzcA family heavy metal efflux pump